MAIAKKQFCDFVVWTPLGMAISRVCFNASLWEDRHIKLKDFYFTKMFERLEEETLLIFMNCHLLIIRRSGG